MQETFAAATCRGHQGQLLRKREAEVWNLTKGPMNGFDLIPFNVHTGYLFYFWDFIVMHFIGPVLVMIISWVPFPSFFNVVWNELAEAE